VRWPDFGLPADPADMAAAIHQAWTRAETERDGVPADDAVAYVREHYRPHAVETTAQADFVSRFQPS